MIRAQGHKIIRIIPRFFASNMMNVGVFKSAYYARGSIFAPWSPRTLWTFATPTRWRSAPLAHALLFPVCAPLLSVFSCLLSAQVACGVPRSCLFRATPTANSAFFKTRSPSFHTINISRNGIYFNPVAQSWPTAPDEAGQKGSKCPRNPSARSPRRSPTLSGQSADSAIPMATGRRKSTS